MNKPNPTSHAVREEVIGLLRPSGSSWRFSRSGVIDVLGESDPIGSRVGHQLVNSRLLPRIYERVWRPITGRLFFGSQMARGKDLRLTMEMLDVSAGDRVLDVGCGPGNSTRPLAQQASPGVVVGIDASRSMLDVAMNHDGGANLAYVRGDACELPFADGKFDKVCCVGVIHMIDDAMRALGEMVRVLAPGGRLVIVASYGDIGAKTTAPGGVRVFVGDEMTEAYAQRGLVDIKQHVSHRAQFVSGLKVEE